MSAAVPDRLWAYALFAGAMSSAGVPLYLYAPKFYFDNYGVGLATLGLALFCLRLLDVVQDPLLGEIFDALHENATMASLDLWGMDLQVRAANSCAEMSTWQPGWARHARWCCRGHP